MKISIDIKSGKVEITSDTALSLRQDYRDRLHTGIEGLMGAIITTMGDGAAPSSEAEPTSDAVTGSAPEGNQVMGTHQDSCSEDTITQALRQMLADEPQWGQRTAKAIIKYLSASYTEEATQRALMQAVESGVIRTWSRRDGVSVYGIE